MLPSVTCNPLSHGLDMGPWAYKSGLLTTEGRDGIDSQVMYLLSSNLFDERRPIADVFSTGCFVSDITIADQYLPLCRDQLPGNCMLSPRTSCHHLHLFICLALCILYVIKSRSRIVHALASLVLVSSTPTPPPHGRPCKFEHPL